MIFDSGKWEIFENEHSFSYLGNPFQFIFELFFGFWCCVNDLTAPVKVTQRKYTEYSIKNSVQHMLCVNRKYWRQHTYLDFVLYSRTLSKNNCWIGSVAFCMAGTMTPKLRRHSDDTIRMPDRTVLVIICKKKTNNYRKNESNKRNSI